MVEVKSDFIPAKQLLVNAISEQGSFIVFEHNGIYYSAESLTDDFPDGCSAAIWYDKKEMVNDIGWWPYIFSGITEHGVEVFGDLMSKIKKLAKEYE